MNMTKSIRFLLISLSAVFGFSTYGLADVYDRINDCEDQGGGSCVFDLLRELARNSNGSVLHLSAVGSYEKKSGDYNCDRLRVLSSTEDEIKVAFSGRCTAILTAKCVKNRCTGKDSQGSARVLVKLSDTRFRYMATSQGRSSVYEAL